MPRTLTIVPATPPAIRCANTERLWLIASLQTDFGGMVVVWVCRRCGVVAVETTGERPE